MAFDPDHDLVSDFNELIGGKKKGSPIDFEFSEKNAKSLDFGFDGGGGGGGFVACKITVSKGSKPLPLRCAVLSAVLDSEVAFFFPACVNLDLNLACLALRLSSIVTIILQNSHKVCQ